MLERFVEEYAEPAYQFALQLSGNVDQARELVQEAFFRVLKNVGRWAEGEPPRDYFFAILRNLYADNFRSFENRKMLSLDTPLGEGEDLNMADALPDASEPQLERLERQESSRRVRRAISRLLPEFRAVLILADIRRLPYPDIAKVLGCPLGTVRSRVWRARQALKAKLAEEVEAHAV